MPFWLVFEARCGREDCKALCKQPASAEQALTWACPRRSLLPAEVLEREDVSSRLPAHFRLVVAVNKADLLPNQVTAQRLEVREAQPGALKGALAVV